MGEPDETMTAIGRGIELTHRGEWEEARRLFAQLWDMLPPDGDALHRCALAHAMADVQEDPGDELAWDLCALAAADQVTDERAAAAGMSGPVAAFYPSLHLNLGEDYRKLGDTESARRHLELGRRHVDALDDDGYGRMVRSGLDGLAARLAGG